MHVDAGFSIIITMMESGVLTSETRHRRRRSDAFSSYFAGVLFRRSCTPFSAWGNPFTSFELLRSNYPSNTTRVSEQIIRLG